MIKRLTQEQWDYIPEHIQKYFDMATKPIDKDRFTRALAKMYKKEGLDPPLVLFFESPLSFKAALPLLDSHLSNKLREQTIDQLDRHIGDQLFFKLDEQLRFRELNRHPYRQLHDELIRQLNRQFYGRLENQPGTQLSNQLRSQIFRQLGDQLEGHCDNENELVRRLVRYWWLNIWCLDQACWFSFMKHISVEFDEETYNDFLDFCEETIFGTPYPGIYFASEKPVEVHWQNRLLHNDNGPAILFRDGYSLYALNGTRVSREIVETPANELDPELAIREENAEVRSEIIRKIGIEQFIYKIGAETIDKWGDYELFDLSKQFEKKMQLKPKYLKMKNPSTGKWHVEGVPPGIATCKQALSWRIGGRKWNPTQIT